MELTRPMDFQSRFWWKNLAEVTSMLVMRIPVFLIAWLLMGMQLPPDPGLWGFLRFTLSWHIDHLHVRLFFCSLAFYTTETWG